MASINAPSKRDPVFNHEGIRSPHFTQLQQLQRSVLTALLWEDAFYESGATHAKRVRELCTQVPPEKVAELAIQAREAMYLRHVPLFLVYQLSKIKGQGPLVASTLERVIQRPDELTEYVAIHYADPDFQDPKRQGANKGRHPLSKGSRNALRAAFGKFNRYSLAKYRSKNKAVKLSDVLRLVRPKPKDAEQSALWKELRAGTLVSTDTWESELSAGKGKKETFERLIAEGKLGGLAFLRNLRNMEQAGVDRALIKQRFEGDFKKVLPFRFLAAARHAQGWAAELSDAMLRVIPDSRVPRLGGTTAILVDVSPSMAHPVSEKSEIQRRDAGAGLAVLIREVADHARVFAFSDDTREVPAHRGLPLADAIIRAVPSNGTRLGAAIAYVNTIPHDRLIVVTDEQSQDRVGAPKADRAYMINLAQYHVGVGQEGKWERINGWSERIIDYIAAVEDLGVRD